LFTIGYSPVKSGVNFSNWALLPTKNEQLLSILDRIIMLIKSENEYLIHNGDGEVTCIADEPDNGKTLDILREFDLDDDTNVLEEVFGSDGAKAIRDAEQGIY